MYLLHVSVKWVNLLSGVAGLWVPSAHDGLLKIIHTRREYENGDRHGSLINAGSADNLKIEERRYKLLSANKVTYNNAAKLGQCLIDDSILRWLHKNDSMNDSLSRKLPSILVNIVRSGTRLWHEWVWQSRLNSLEVESKEFWYYISVKEFKIIRNPFNSQSALGTFYYRSIDQSVTCVAAISVFINKKDVDATE